MIQTKFLNTYVFRNRIFLLKSLFYILGWGPNLKFSWSWWLQNSNVLLYIRYQTWCLYFVSWHRKMKSKKKCDMMGAKFIIQRWNMSMKQAHVCYVKYGLLTFLDLEKGAFLLCLSPWYIYPQYQNWKQIFDKSNIITSIHQFETRTRVSHKQNVYCVKYKWL